MDTRYAKWIAEHVTDPVGTCREVTEQMAQAFPELRRVRGHVHLRRSRAHWWLVTPGGEIVDPTAAQFVQLGLLLNPVLLDACLYEEYVGPEPAGRCLGCGEPVYGVAQTCSNECRASVLAEIDAAGRL